MITYDKGRDHVKANDAGDPEPRRRPLIIDASSTHCEEGESGTKEGRRATSEKRERERREYFKRRVKRVF
jgi:hypothetical protein